MTSDELARRGPGPAEPATVSEMFAIRLRSDSDAAFLLAADGTSWTYGDIAANAARLARRLREEGVKRGDVVGLYLWNEPAWVVACLAAWSLGAVIAVCGAVSPQAEAVRRFNLVKARVVVVADDVPLSGWKTVSVGRAGELEGDVAAVAAFCPGEPEAEADACIFFTSGTTGDAKALIKSHGSLIDQQRQNIGAYSRSGGFRPRAAAPTKPPAISFNPFGQVASFGRLVFRLYVGRPMVMVRKFDVETVSALAKRYAPDTLQLTPGMVYMLAHAEGDVDLSSVQYVTSGTAPLGPATRDAFEARFHIPVLQTYGSTEGGVAALERYEDVIAGRRGPGSVGRIVDGSEWRIIRPDGTDVSPGEDGEILGRPDQLRVVTSAGESRLPLDAEGWYHTGDIGHVDANRILYITGRIKEMLIVGGFNVYPVEVEDALRRSSLVRDAVVVALPDERLGEIPVAGIVWEPSAIAEIPDVHARLQRLAAETRALIEAYKLPRRWFSSDAVALTPNGKVDRRAAVSQASQSAVPIRPAAQGD
jgi:long-chain acyl-CoA synthetase